MDPEYKILDAEYDATEAANKELLTAFTCTGRAVHTFLQKFHRLGGLNTIGSPTETTINNLQMTVKMVLDEQAMPRLNELVEAYKKTYMRMVKRRHKLMDYDKCRLAVAKAKQHQMAKLQSQFEAASVEYNRYNDLLKRELPQLFSHRKTMIQALVMQYEDFMRIFFQAIPQLLIVKEGKDPVKSYVDIQKDFERQEQLMRDVLDGLSLISMTAHRTENVVDQLTGKLKSSLKIGEKSITELRNTSRPPTNSYYHSNSSNNVDYNNDNEREGLATKKEEMNDIRPTAQPNAIKVYPPSSSSSLSQTFPTINQTKSKLPPTAVALYDFEGAEASDLPFKSGDRIVVTKKSDSQDDWWTGYVLLATGDDNKRREGIFPANYVKMLL